MRREDKRIAAARRIAVLAGALQECDLHIDELFAGWRPADAAYQLATQMCRQGELRGFFTSKAQLAEHIDKVLEKATAQECPICARIRAQRRCN